MGCDQCNGTCAVYVNKGEIEELGDYEGYICPYFFRKGPEYEEGRGKDGNDMERVIYNEGSMTITFYKCLLGNGKSRAVKNSDELLEAAESPLDIAET